MQVPSAARLIAAALTLAFYLPGSAQATLEPGFPFQDEETCRAFSGAPDDPLAAELCRSARQSWDGASGFAASAPFSVVRIDATSFPPVDPSAFVRLVTLPNLLPANLPGGLVLTGAEFSGPLLFLASRVAIPLVLDDVQLPASTVDFLSRGGRTVANVSLYIDDSIFERGLRVSRSMTRGRTLIVRSRFAGGVEFNRLAASVLDQDVTFLIEASRFESSLLFRYKLSGDERYSGSLTPEVVIFDSSIAGTLQFQDVELPALTMENIDAKNLFFQNSYISSDLSVRGSLLRNVVFEDTVITDTLRFQENDVDRNLYFRNTGSTVIPCIRFSQNRVAGSTTFATGFEELIGVPPACAWRDAFGAEAVRIDFSHNVLGSLQFGPGLDECAPGASERAPMCALGQGAAGSPEDATRLGPRTWVDLESTQVQAVAWNGAAIAAGLRWTGRDFSYGGWSSWRPRAPGQGGPRPDSWEADYQRFLESVDPRNLINANDHGADFLRQAGYLSAATDRLVVAKRANYLPSPNWDSLGVLDRPGVCVRNFVDCLTYALLLPTDFGVQPQLALVWLLITIVIGAAVYTIYVRLPDATGHADMDEAYLGQRTLVNGFRAIDNDLFPRKFSAIRYSIDASIPVINFHAYDHYYPTSPWIRGIAGFQHLLGWWFISVFIAGLAAL